MSIGYHTEYDFSYAEGYEKGKKDAQPVGVLRSEMAELKPCPFCGGEAKLWVASAKWNPDGSTTICGWKAGCTKCRIETDIEDSGLAIEKWNRRTGNGKET